jgi:hypothetical protein
MTIGAAPATAGAAPAAKVLVTVDGVSRPAISLDCSVVTCDVPNNPAYPNQVSTEGTTIAVPAGLSAAMIATLSGCDPTSVQTMVIEPSTGLAVTLGAGEVAAPTTFLDGLQAVFYDNGSGTASFRRPLRSSSDMNGLDTRQPGSKLNVAITTPVSCLSVNAVVDHTKTMVGKALQFTVTAQNPEPGVTLTATWDFRDGKTATATLTSTGDTASAVTAHAYRHTGTYSPVTVTVSPVGGQGPSGSGSIRRITVGKAAGAPGPGTKHPNRHHRSTSGSPTAEATQPVSGTGSGGTSPTAQPAAHPQKHPHPQPAGTPVSGVLVGSTSTSAAPPSAAQGVGGTESTGSSGAPVEAIGGGALALGLVALGAFSDRRGLRRRRKLPA